MRHPRSRRVGDPKTQALVLWTPAPTHSGTLCTYHHKSLKEIAGAENRQVHVDRGRDGASTTDRGLAHLQWTHGLRGRVSLGLWRPGPSGSPGVPVSASMIATGIGVR